MNKQKYYMYRPISSKQAALPPETAVYAPIDS